MKDNRMTRRTFLKTGGAVVVAMSVGPIRTERVAAQTTAAADRFLGKTVATDAVDGFLSIHADGTVTLFSGKVDLGTGARAALRQMAAEELDVPVGRITMIEGDTALTPDQGTTAGSAGVARGGMQVRRAAATARQALVVRASQRLGRPLLVFLVDADVDQEIGEPPGGVRFVLDLRDVFLVFLVRFGAGGVARLPSVLYFDSSRVGQPRCRFQGLVDASPLVSSGEDSWFRSSPK